MAEPQVFSTRMGRHSARQTGAPPAEPAPATARLAEPLKAGVLSAGLFAGFLLAWQAIAAHTTAQGGGLPDPVETARAARELLADPFYDFGPNDKGTALQLLFSLRRLMTAYATASALAILMGVTLGLYPLLFRAVNPYVQVLKTVSPLAWMPMFLYTVRDAERAVFLVVVMSTLWPIITNTAFGVSTIDRDYLHVASVLQLSWFKRLVRVVLPAAAPSIVVGLRIAIGSAWISLVAAEMLVGGTGIGYFVWNEWNNLALTSVILGIVLIGGVGFLLDAGLGALSRAVAYSR